MSGTTPAAAVPAPQAAAADGSRGPLEDLVVLDLSSFMAAPMAAMWLADFGAQVIKVEHPRGDMMRDWGSRRDGVPLFWKMVGRNKESITLDLHEDAARDVLRRLVEKADVVVENFRPGTLAEWGLAYEALAEVNPRLIMLSVSAFGQTGPYSHRRGFGTLAEAMSGYAYMTGEPDGPPTLPSFGLADGVTGLTGAFAVLAAVHEQRLSGRGQHIDLALYEGLMTVMGHQFVEYDQLGIVAERLGSRLPFAAPRNAYQAADGGWLAMSSSSQSVFERACKAIGRPELIEDPRFLDNQARTQNNDELDRIFAEWIGSKPRQEAIDVLNEAGAAAAPIYSIEEVFEDPHFRERGNVARVEDVELGEIGMQNVVPSFSRTPGQLRHAGPRLGEHTDRVLNDMIGLSAEEIAELREQGAV
ncbi:MAG TPA: CoA transferase [Solirubrobacterales bacterium]|jgi:formyl-CoA transferase